VSGKRQDALRITNMKTAKSLGLTIPESFLLRADEMIELENLLQCECRLLALSGSSLRCNSSVALGRKADIIASRLPLSIA
jgi:hypothetical protein